MSISLLFEKFEQLPPRARNQARDFINFLYERYASKKTPSADPGERISENAFFGRWKDRKEMNDSVKWVRNVRKSQWTGK
ncbi:MAG: hypothetical protein WD048_00015 [Chitinophagales bacterium]